MVNDIDPPTILFSRDYRKATRQRNRVASGLGSEDESEVAPTYRKVAGNLVVSVREAGSSHGIGGEQVGVGFTDGVPAPGFGGIGKPHHGVFRVKRHDRVELVGGNRLAPSLVYSLRARGGCRCGGQGHGG